MWDYFNGMPTQKQFFPAKGRNTRRADTRNQRLEKSDIWFFCPRTAIHGIRTIWVMRSWKIQYPQLWDLFLFSIPNKILFFSRWRNQEFDFENLKKMKFQNQNSDFCLSACPCKCCPRTKKLEFWFSEFWFSRVRLPCITTLSRYSELIIFPDAPTRPIKDN